MSRPFYRDLLTKEEQQTAINVGVKLACARNGLKQGSVVDDTFNTFGRAILGISVLTGVPIGIASHLVHRAMTSDQVAQREQRAKIKYYRDVTNELSQGLTPPEKPVQPAL